MAEQFTDFESGALPSNWTLEDTSWGVQSPSHASGTYSFGPDSTGSGNNALKATWNVADANGSKAFYAEWHYYETSSNKGCAMYAMDPNGNTIAAIGTDNPAKRIVSGNGHEDIDNGNYGEWVRARITFHWDTFEVSFEFEQPNGAIANATRIMIGEPSAFGYLEFAGYNSGSRYSSSNSWWADDITLSFPVPMRVEGSVTKDGVGVKRHVHIVSAADGSVRGHTRSDFAGNYGVTFENDGKPDVYVIVEGETVASERGVVHGPVSPTEV